MIVGMSQGFQMHGANIRLEQSSAAGVASTCRHCAELRAKLRDSLVAQRRLEVDVARREEDRNLLRLLASKVRAFVLHNSSHYAPSEDHAVLRATVLDLIEALEYAQRERDSGRLPTLTATTSTIESDLHGASWPVGHSVASINEIDASDPEVVKNLKYSLQQASGARYDSLPNQNDLEAETVRLHQRCEELFAGQEALERLSLQQNKELARLRTENEELRTLHLKSVSAPPKRPPKSPLRNRTPPHGASPRLVSPPKPSSLSLVSPPRKDKSPREKLSYDASVEDIRLQDTFCSVDSSLSPRSANTATNDLLTEQTQLHSGRRPNSRGRQAENQSSMSEGCVSRVSNDWRQSLRA